MLTSDDIRAVIRDTVMGVDAAAMKDEQVFKSAGVDSLDAINVLLALEERHGVHIPDEDVKQCNSIAAILAYVNKADAA
jgi:acyl carrier protein